jgi:uncharacterized protein (DUF1800 family)
MATYDALQTTWTPEDVLHFARRAGFGVTPEVAASLAALPPGQVIDDWVDAVADEGALVSALANGDVVASSANGAIPADPAPHPFRLDPWRNQSGIRAAQARFTFGMQYGPNPLKEKLALFWHQLLATGASKVDNPAFMGRHTDLLRSEVARDRFPALLLAMSQDPAMLVWLDSVQNRVHPGTTDVPNENYAREVLELYSLGVDNGYSQQDITHLAVALSGWNLVIDPADLRTDPNSPTNIKPVSATFRVFQGQANTAPVDPRFGATLPHWHATGTVSFLGGTYDIGSPSNDGETLLDAIFALNGGANAARFLASRLLLFFVTPTPGTADVNDLQALLQANGFHLANTLKALFKSQYFFAPAHRHSLYEGPVAWTVRAARMLCPDLATASAASPLPLYPAWRTVAQAWDGAGQEVLDPDGPNGWKEHRGWINSNTLRWRGKLAAALTLGETLTGSQMVFPTTFTDWFPVAPTSAVQAFDRLVALLQPAPIPPGVRDAWLAALWPSAFAWDGSASTQQKVRELAYLILNSPQAQLH